MKFLKLLAHRPLKKGIILIVFLVWASSGVSYITLEILASFLFVLITFYFHDNHANALKASRCVQIHATVLSLLAIRLCRIRRALFMAYHMRKGMPAS